MFPDSGMQQYFCRSRFATFLFLQGGGPQQTYLLPPESELQQNGLWQESGIQQRDRFPESGLQLSICIYISRFRIATKYLSLPSQDYDYKEMESCSYLSMQKAGCSRIQECKSISADPGLQHLFYSSKGRTATDILTSSRVRIATKRSLARIRNPAKG